MKLNVKSFSLALMIFYGAIIFIFGFWHALTGFGADFVKVFESLHPTIVKLNYMENVPTFTSLFKNLPAVLINLIWALIDGLIIGVCVSGLYNWLNKVEAKKLKKKEASAKGGGKRK